MTHVIGHIICGGAGECTGERQITIYDHEVLNVAVALKYEGLAKYGLSERQAQRLGRMIQRDVDRWYEKLEKLGIPVEEYEPHGENLEEPPV